ILHLQLTDLLEQLIALLLKEILLRILLCLEHRGSSFQELSLPGGDLVGMQVELLGQLAYCFALAERLYHHFSFERGGELASVSSAHRKGKLGYARSLSSFSRPPQLFIIPIQLFSNILNSYIYFEINIFIGLVGPLVDIVALNDVLRFSFTSKLIGLKDSNNYI